MPVRRPRIDFESEVNPYYLQNNAFISHFSSAYNFLFPEGEKFFIESVLTFKDKIQNPRLREEVKNFCGQEQQHRNQTTGFLRGLMKNGYKMEGLMKFLKWYHRKFMRRLPAGYQLAYTAGSEHFTAVFASAVLKSRILDGASPAARQLFIWHAIEEIEHKHVSYDVLQEMHPKNYFLRILAFIHSNMAIWGAAIFGTAKLIIQDLKSGRLKFKNITKKDNHMARLLRNRKSRTFLKLLILPSFRYFKPGFHPNQTQYDNLTNSYQSELKGFT